MDAAAAPIEQARLAADWRRSAMFFAVTLAALALGYHATFADMVRVWSTASTFNHCFLILPISLFLIWERRAEVARIAPAPSLLGVGYVGVNALLWLTGEVLGIAFFQHAAAVGMLIGIVWALLGGELTRTLSFPLFYLYFSVPEGEFLVPYLQDLTAQMSVWWLQVTGVPVFLENRYISIPSGRFVVAEACSGINYLIATLAVGTLFAYLAYRSWVRRAVFMALAVLVPIAANGLRAYGVIMIAHLSGYKHAVGVDHVIYGWLFFGVVTLILFAIGNTFSDASHGRWVIQPFHPAPGPRRSLEATAAVTLALALAGPAATAMGALERLPAGVIELPTSRGGWSVPMASADLLGGKYVGASQRLVAAYSGNGGQVVLDVAYYASEARGREVISSANLLYDRKSFARMAEATVTAGEAPVRQLILRRENGDLLVWHWYDIHGRATSSRLGAKLLAARARLFGSDLGAASMAVYTTVDGDAEAAASRLKAFVAEMSPRLSALTVKR